MPRRSRHGTLPELLLRCEDKQFRPQTFDLSFCILASWEVRRGSLAKELSGCPNDDMSFTDQ